MSLSMRRTLNLIHIHLQGAKVLVVSDIGEDQMRSPQSKIRTYLLFMECNEGNPYEPQKWFFLRLRRKKAEKLKLFLFPCSLIHCLRHSFLASCSAVGFAVGLVGSDSYLVGSRFRLLSLLPCLLSKSTLSSSFSLNGLSPILFPDLIQRLLFHWSYSVEVFSYFSYLSHLVSIFMPIKMRRLLTLVAFEPKPTFA